MEKTNAMRLLERVGAPYTVHTYAGGALSGTEVAAALGEEAVTLEDVCEPYLMQMGYLTRTPRGRCVTKYAYEHLGIRQPGARENRDDGQQSFDDL